MYKNGSFLPLADTQKQAISKAETDKYLSKIKYCAKELQFHIQPSWLLVEQPPEAAGQILLKKL